MGFWDSYNAAYGATKTAADQARQSAATAKISGALASGDYDGAAQAAYQAGQFQQGALLMQQGQQQKRAAALGALASSFHPAATGALAAPVPAAAPSAGALNPAPAQPAPAPTVDATGAPVAAPVTVTAKPFSGSLCDLTRAPVHDMSPETAQAAQNALAAGVPMEAITQAVSLGHQLNDTDDAARTANADAVTKLAQQALGIDKGADGSTDPAAIQAARKAFVTSQINNVVSDPTQRANFRQAAEGFDYGDANLQNFVNARQSVADVIKASRADADAAQKQANFETTSAETARHNRASEALTASGQAVSRANNAATVGATIRGQNLRKEGEGGYAPINLGAAAGSASLPSGFTASGENADDQ